ncbi:hypothetical protein SMACR_08689 [Sordaria macrospora]|uniref:Uncharacterized protein n=1 Tax=Sordaria macrospora TaxID=5147 RepID=A0A8S8ZMG8_SORMA|nr:hypothetical protein SMACR_08689 [Sordaria macrospora]KAH7635347.1 hypothetical protein B0T09DRAFT_22233 [Sordaria sp. MPI-SDFR-AT-0083]WPJ67288.1 hypothetical protein SMAC4_08689 [Sordaria macrospora]
MAPLPLPHIPASTIDKFENIIFKRVVYPALQGVEAIHPTRTLSPITRRQDAPPAATVTVVQAADDDDDDPTDASTLSGGAIAGIVIGSIAGLLLLIWIIRSCSNLGAPPTDDKPNGKAWYHGVRDEYPPRHVGGVRHSHSRGRGHSRHRSHSRRSSMREVPVVVAEPKYVYDDRRGRSARRSRSRSVSRY